jgi:hypothetical protein
LAKDEGGVERQRNELLIQKKRKAQIAWIKEGRKMGKEQEKRKQMRRGSPRAIVFAT